MSPQYNLTATSGPDHNWWQHLHETDTNSLAARLRSSLGLYKTTFKYLFYSSFYIQVSLVAQAGKVLHFSGYYYVSVIVALYSKKKEREREIEAAAKTNSKVTFPEELVWSFGSFNSFPHDLTSASIFLFFCHSPALLSSSKTFSVLPCSFSVLQRTYF